MQALTLEPIFHNALALSPFRVIMSSKVGIGHQIIRFLQVGLTRYGIMRDDYNHDGKKKPTELAAKISLIYITSLESGTTGCFYVPGQGEGR